MDHLLLVLVAILAFLIGYFVCQKINTPTAENFSPLHESLDLDDRDYGRINAELRKIPLEDNDEVPVADEQASHEQTRMAKMMQLNGKDEIDNVETFAANDPDEDSVFDNMYASVDIES